MFQIVVALLSAVDSLLVSEYNYAHTRAGSVGHTARIDYAPVEISGRIAGVECRESVSIFQLGKSFFCVV